MNRKFFTGALAILLLLLSSTTIYGQAARIITGRVTDQNGEPLPGASVVVAGTTTATQTDQNGNYQITVENPASAVLEFTYVGTVNSRFR